MASIAVLIKINSAEAGLYAASGSPHKCLKNLENTLIGLDAGNLAGSIDVSVNSNDPVAAAGVVALTYGSIANLDTLTICNQVLTCVTGTPSTAQFKKQTDATTTGDNLVAAIAAHDTLSQLVTASNASGTVTITAKHKGLFGNGYALTTSNSSGFGLTAFASGAGGATGTVVTYGR